MTATAEKTVTPMTSAKSMHVAIRGKIVSRRRFKQRVLTMIVIPAEDMYSSPSFVEVNSDRSFGEKDEEVSITCKLRGYKRKPFNTTDKETGEQVSIVPVEHVLDLVEA